MRAECVFVLARARASHVVGFPHLETECVMSLPVRVTDAQVVCGGCPPSFCFVNCFECAFHACCWAGQA